jgi:hypothetical protein
LGRLLLEISKIVGAFAAELGKNKSKLKVNKFEGWESREEWTAYV